MSKGLVDQYQWLAEQALKGSVRVETLETSGKWFRDTFEKTPATSVVAMKDWRNEGHRSVWYESRFYRVNLFWEGRAWRFRDVHAFDEKYAERYLSETVKTDHCTYDTLPVVDGFNWSASGGLLAGMRVVTLARDGTPHPVECGEPAVTESGEDSLLVAIPVVSGGAVTLRLEPAAIRVEIAGDGAPREWALEVAWDASKPTSIAGVDEHAIRYRHNGFDYSLRCGEASVSMASDAHSVRIVPKGQVLTLSF